MKTIDMIETFDGKQHADEDAANNHLDDLLDAAISPLAHKLSHPIKYTEIRELLSSEVETMRLIVRIHDDRRLHR